MLGSARQLELRRQCVRGDLVQALPLAGEELVLHGLAHQRVREAASNPVDRLLRVVLVHRRRTIPD
jgi:hypothetical protein